MFSRRRASQWFRLKACVVMFLLFLFTPASWKKGSEPVLKRFPAFRRRLKKSLDSELAGAKYYILEPRWLCRAIGWAGTRCKSRKIILGLERWACRLPLFAASAADHELTHCVQQVWCGALTDEWLPQKFSATCGKKLFFEPPAIIIGFLSAA